MRTFFSWISLVLVTHGLLSLCSSWRLLKGPTSGHVCVPPKAFAQFDCKSTVPGEFASVSSRRNGRSDRIYTALIVNLVLGDGCSRFVETKWFRILFKSKLMVLLAVLVEYSSKVMFGFLCCGDRIWLKWVATAPSGKVT